MDWFEKYQTFIAGILGFIGVMLTISFNAKQARKQHDTELESERNAMRVALVEELKIVSKSYQSNIEGLSEQCEPSTIEYFPTSVHIYTYSHVVQRLGLLGAEETKKVMLAYQLIESHDKETYREGFIAIEAPQREMALAVYSSFLGSVSDAIFSLSKNIKAS
ncbi:hypothetical protein [Vibrio vulnificus]|uniref:hypothetical protein n=1 Tax=Vibrio vulnificus TaxID=672 RepID=UPI001CDD8C42|nr:hypothetical protein [Vibrio vulnificus]MCA3993005.1 hypothetical protein [Vibrio vulnificus]HDY7704271.1 hypothetical protein [Vibrio vulnificus]